MQILICSNIYKENNSRLVFLPIISKRECIMY